MVVLRIWWGALFVTSPICRARWGSVDGRAAFSVVSRGQRLSLSHRVEPAPATCLIGSAARSHRAAPRRPPFALSTCPKPKTWTNLAIGTRCTDERHFSTVKNSFFVRLPGEKARVYKKIANFTARNFAYEALLLRMFSPLSFLRAWHISAGGADLSTPLSNECPHNGSKPL